MKTSGFHVAPANSFIRVHERSGLNGPHASRALTPKAEAILSARLETEQLSAVGCQIQIETWLLQGTARPNMDLVAEQIAHLPPMLHQSVDVQTHVTLAAMGS